MKPEYAIFAAIALGYPGCTPVQVYAPDQAPEYVTKRKVDFFPYGPQQPGPPEILERETFVKIQSWEPGYSKVTLGDGRSGYVANEEIRVAPPAARPVADEELFPERYALLIPEPDLTMPVEDVPEDAKKVPPSR